MTALNKQARLVSSARISEIANGANLIMGEKEWLANTAIYLANELKTATKAFQSTGFSLLEAEEKLEAAEKRITDYHTVLNNLAAVARRYLPDYDEHPDIQAADGLLESAAGIGVKGD
ncbi:hypothetical protein BEH75_24615 [Citrobacter freundii]|nr:hypothetical protein BEH75_24615 [Citrobacter freundii]